MVSAGDRTEIWEAAKEDALEKARGNKNRVTGADSPMVDEKKVEKSFWLRPRLNYSGKRKLQITFA